MTERVRVPLPGENSHTVDRIARAIAATFEFGQNIGLPKVGRAVGNLVTHVTTSLDKPVAGIMVGMGAIDRVPSEYLAVSAEQIPREIPEEVA